MTLVVVFIYSCSNSKEEIYVLSGYSGPVVIFYNQKIIKGTSEKKGNTLTIRVPDDGIVFTEFVNTEGEFSIRFADKYFGNKLIRAPRIGSMYLDKEVPYTVFYVGDTLELQKMKGLNFDDLKLIYESNIK